MNRVETFAFRVSNGERQAIAELAIRLQRSQSDAVRFVVVEANRQLTEGIRTDQQTQNKVNEAKNESPS